MAADIVSACTSIENLLNRGTWTDFTSEKIVSPINQQLIESVWHSICGNSYLSSYLKVIYTALYFSWFNQYIYNKNIALQKNGGFRADSFQHLPGNGSILL